MKVSTRTVPRGLVVPSRGDVSMIRPGLFSVAGEPVSRQNHPRYYTASTAVSREGKPDKERVVILGSGWAGYALARTLDPARYERIVVSPRSHFVFTPLLASTAVGTVEFRAVLEPVRRLRDISFHQGWADDIDFARKRVTVEANASVDDVAGRRADGGEVGVAKGHLHDVAYDKLVIAVGSYSQTFGIPGVREHACFLRDVGDARRIRLRVLSLFELASADAGAVTDDQRRELLHFAVVGGGPTGIEFAAELHDLVHEDLARVYPPELIRLVRITVYDIAPTVLPMFDRKLAEYAVGVFKRQGISVRTQHHLLGVRAGDEGSGGALKLRIQEHGDEEIGAGMVVWSTGLMQNPLVGRLTDKEFGLPPPGGGDDAAAAGKQGGEGGNPLFRLEKDAKTGGIVTDAHLRARLTSPTSSSSGQQRDSSVLEDVYVIGDCAVMENQRALPKTAQVASQQAAYLGRRLNKEAKEKKKQEKKEQNNSLLGGGLTGEPGFRFRNWGSMAYLGSWKAIHQSSADELKGSAAWVLWRTAYLTYSMSVRNKIMVPVYWMISWLFGRDISRF